VNREQKAQIVEDLKEAMAKCSSGIFTDYKGLSNAELTLLRRKLREIGIEYRVVKNTLARFAAEKAGKDFLTSSLEGPVAIAFGYDDIAGPAKVLTNFIRSSESTLSITGGFLGDRLLNQNDVKSLASIPSREVLLAQVLGGMQSPIVALVNCFVHPLREFSGIMQARIKQLEEN
jgi:large subunit ribosomal protein L10